MYVEVIGYDSGEVKVSRYRSILYYYYYYLLRIYDFPNYLLLPIVRGIESGSISGDYDFG